MEQARLDEIKARCDKATAGPWIMENEPKGSRFYGVVHGKGGVSFSGNAADNCFIAHSREDVPELLAEVERLTAENAEYKKRLQNEHTYCENLAAYEDTGFMPEEIADHEEMFKAYRHVCGGKSPEEIKIMQEQLTAYKKYGLEPCDMRLMKSTLEENAAIKSERDTALRALEMACDDMADSACPHDSTEYVCPNASTCPNVNGGCEDTGIDKECWIGYYTRKAKEDLQK